MSTSEQSSNQGSGGSDHSRSSSEAVEMNNGPLSIFSFLAASVRSDNPDFGEFDGDIDADSVSLGSSDDDSDVENEDQDQDQDQSDHSHQQKFPRTRAHHKATDHHNMSRETIGHDTLPLHSGNHSQSSLVSSGTVSPSNPHGQEEAKQSSGHNDNYPQENKKHHHPFKKFASTLEHSVQSLVGRDHNSDHSDEDSTSDSDMEADEHEKDLDDALTHTQASINLSRANDLSNKLRQHLGIGEDEELVGGKYTQCP